MAAEFKHLNLFPDFDFYVQSLSANPLPTNQKDPKPRGNRITAYEYVDLFSRDGISSEVFLEMEYPQVKQYQIWLMKLRN